VAPTAGSRLTATVLPPEIVQTLKPDYVTPAVVLLGHETCPVTGKLFEVGGGWVCQTRWEQTQGVFFRDEFTAEELQGKWDEATSFENARHASQLTESKTGIEERLGKTLAMAPQK
jgi:hypothetical protein